MPSENAEMEPFTPGDYGPVLAALVHIDRRRSLDAGRPETSARAALEALTIDSAFGHAAVADREMASCCISGVWLLHDYLDESHTISQGIESASGSYWHAIMHRREGDFWNSKYWLRRAGRHPVFERVSKRIGETFDPVAFVDRCEAVVGGAEKQRAWCLDVQQAEWETLFDHCYRTAVGDG
jgi:hypothetical protein